MKIYVFRVSLGEQSQTILENAGYTKDEISDEMRYGAKEHIMEMIENIAGKTEPDWIEGDINENEVGG